MLLSATYCKCNMCFFGDNGEVEQRSGCSACVAMLEEGSEEFEDRTFDFV